jgi:hypothetical protein
LHPSAGKELEEALHTAEARAEELEARQQLFTSLLGQFFAFQVDACT